MLSPQGAKLFGVYVPRVIDGHERVWWPDRACLSGWFRRHVGAMPGADMAGNTGYTDEVNNHYLAFSARPSS
jgi:type IV secretion system protein VirB10